MVMIVNVATLFEPLKYYSAKIYRVEPPNNGATIDPVYYLHIYGEHMHGLLV